MEPDTSIKEYKIGGGRLSVETSFADSDVYQCCVFHGALETSVVILTGSFPLWAGWL